MSAVTSDVKPLTERERYVLRMRYGVGLKRELSLQEIGKQLGVSRERIRQIESAALHKLRHCKDYETLRSYWEE